MDMNMVMYPEITGEGYPSDSSQMNNMQHDNMPARMLSGGSIVTLNYGMMRSPTPTALPEGPMKTLHFNLTGNMNRYVRTLDNKTVNEADRILIQKGENVRIILTNHSMMRHPCTCTDMISGC